MTHGINELTQQAARTYATNLNMSPYEKYLLLSQCKISVAFNNFHLSKDNIANILEKPKWEKNQAFRGINQGLAPQFKSRVNEAAALGVLNLVERDSWNVIEDFYEPGKDFIYFEDLDDLKEKIPSIINGYDDYLPIRVNAYRKSQRYTAKCAYFDIASSCDWSTTK
jgi:hypothetical protein